MMKERVKLVIYFCSGLVIGLIFNFNIAASENIQETKNIVATEELAKINVKLDAVLVNQELMAKELRRIFGRIH